jgi:ABC-type Fe3+/spermidine/putrescine transport system ATPase subunit
MDELLRLEGISKRFGRVKAVDRLCLSIGKGELFTLVGPSGCGKTTALRIIAGLEQPDEGRIICRGATFASVADRLFVPPEKRGIGMVFQSLALWPHRTVYQNVAYPLEIRGVAPREVAARVTRMLHMVGMAGFNTRPVPTLSGGEQQRVALARALVCEPDLLLLDEPFASLDPALRRRMNVEIRGLIRRLGLSSIFVTHDQQDAFASDRLAVMNAGRLEQTGTPADAYDRPLTRFVRDFLGRTLTIRGRVIAVEDDNLSIELPRAGRILISRDAKGANLAALGHDINVSIRPEALSYDESPSDGLNGANGIVGIIETVTFAGDRLEALLRIGNERVTIHLPRARNARAGQTLSLRLPTGQVTLWRETD